MLRRINTSASWWGDWHLEVRVRAPRGRTAAAIFYGTSGMQQHTFYVNYPTDFPDAPPIEHPGEYVFSWRRVDAERTILAQDTIVLTDEMLDPNVLAHVPEDVPDYRSRYWRGEVPVERKKVTGEVEVDTRMDVRRSVPDHEPAT